MSEPSIYATFERMNETIIMFNDVIEWSRKGDYQKVKTYLNATIVLARSITQSFQKEFSKHPMFNLWWSENQEFMKKDDVFIFFNNERNIILKEGKDPLDNKIHTAIISVDPSDAIKFDVVEREIHYYFFFKKNRKEAIKYTNEYLIKLGNIINEWREHGT